tara:strand:- start:303 stop:554 length:252 start_codon:yes stop_codon:yes gene_type:complete
MFQMDIDKIDIEEINFLHPNKKIKISNSIKDTEYPIPIDVPYSMESNISNSFDESYIVQQLNQLENICKTLLNKITDLKFELE